MSDEAGASRIVNEFEIDVEQVAEFEWPARLRAGIPVKVTAKGRA